MSSNLSPIAQSLAFKSESNELDAAVYSFDSKLSNAASELADTLANEENFEAGEDYIEENNGAPRVDNPTSNDESETQSAIQVEDLLDDSTIGVHDLGLRGRYPKKMLGQTQDENKTLAENASFNLPDNGVQAEVRIYDKCHVQVVLIMTSLGSFRKQFMSSIKAQHFLDCKGVPYILIDANRDVSQGTGLLDQEFLAEWLDADILLPDSQQVNSKYLIPQIIIDGISIGREIDLQDLEEDCDLDWILARASCANCLHERDMYAPSCAVCRAEFKELVDMNLVYGNQVKRYCRGLPCTEEVSRNEIHHNFNEIVSNALAVDLDVFSDTDVVYEDFFGEKPPSA